MNEKRLTNLGHAINQLREYREYPKSTGHLTFTRLVRRYRSDESFDCYRVMGLFEEPVIYAHFSVFDEQLRDYLDDAETGVAITIEKISMTGRQLGRLTYSEEW